MPVVSRPLPLAACLTALLVAGGSTRPAAAADWRQSYLEPAVQAWMGLVTLLAEDGERAEKEKPERCDGGCKHCDRKDEKDDKRRKGDAGEWKWDCRGDCETCRGKGRADHGYQHGGGEHRGPHGDRPGHRWHAGPALHGGPAHGRMGPPRPEGPRGDALATLNDIVGRLSRIEAMLAGRGPMTGRGPDGPQASSEMRAMMEARMKEGREKMKAARERFKEMEQRVKRLEAEVARMKEAAEKDD
jgi:hypothetical protein